ncbi:glutamate-cysteine ligase family protein [Nitriliruptor alkaliphilus]|uniref:glutamate-cysteine ligase family protein n=1 Tax=Nitriliruptor alkaliphilus TaxID=427918 RepID=UPI000698B160|nr:glutamate-cysteine ligase family protein [Nitriliruptor alkaliphilus]
MGRDIDEVRFTREDRQRYREKVKLDIEVLRRMLESGAFERGRKLIGIEVEFHVVDNDGEPAMINDQLLRKLENPDFQTELAQFNIEFNVAPHKLSGTVFREIEEELETSQRYAQTQARELDAQVATIGILPTLSGLHTTIQNLSANPRYHLLNEQILEARGEDLLVEIEGTERLELSTSSIMMEAAATSVQLHLQVSPEGFGRTWNAAQAISAAQVAVGANSPFLFGKELWRETRIALFQQTIDTRTEELTAQGVRPRVWFGERWIDDVMDLFDENVRYFNALLPLIEDEDPVAVLDGGGVPHLPELQLHNGTVYRWNRPIYDVARGKPHLRVENRVLPAGPTVVDTVANAALYYGLVRELAGSDEPIERQLSFTAARDNFFTAACDGIEAELFWPSTGNVPASELVLRTLLPLAHSGLDAWLVDRRDRDHYLGVIEQRCLKRQTGAGWQVRTFRAFRDRGLERREALTEMTRLYLEGMHSNEPVHTWEVPRT